MAEPEYQKDCSDWLNGCHEVRGEGDRVYLNTLRGKGRRGRLINLSNLVSYRKTSLWRKKGEKLLHRTGGSAH